MKNLKAGDSAIIVSRSWRSGEKKHEPAHVTRVGTKFIYAKVDVEKGMWSQELKFKRSDGIEDTLHRPRTLRTQAMLEEDERREQCENRIRVWYGQGMAKLSLVKLERIVAILDESEQA